MDSHDPLPADRESPSDVAHETQWAPLALVPPLAVAMIFAMAGLVCLCLWLDMLT